LAKSPAPSVRVVMAKSVADRWLQGIAHKEYRFTISGFPTPGKAKKFASSLRSLRDRQHKKEASVSIPAIADLGVRERNDTVEVWSSNVESLRKLAKWAENAGLDTDFIW
jgi:hypothetical protein